MHRTILALVTATAAVLATSGTAQADPHITKASCEAQGGAFVKQGQTRTCTFSREDAFVYTATDTQTTDPAEDGFYHYLVIHDTETCDRTYRTVQYGDEEPETDEISKDNCTTGTEYHCYRLHETDLNPDESERVDVSECTSRGLG